MTMTLEQFLTLTLAQRHIHLAKLLNSISAMESIGDLDNKQIYQTNYDLLSPHLND